MEFVMFTFKSKKEHDKKQLANLIKRHKMYEKTHRSSRFQNISNDILYNDPLIAIGSESILISSFSTVVCYHEKKPVALLIFEHYDIPKSVKNTFSIKKKLKSYHMLGLMGIYVKPEFRNQGIASQLVKMLNEMITSKVNTDKNTVYMIAAMTTSFNLAERYMPTVVPSHNTFNSVFWLDSAKSFLTYYNPEPETLAA
jgi:hypothetical protein